MMGKLAERDKWIVEKMKRGEGEVFNEVPNVQYFGPSHQQRQKPSSLSGSFSNGFCCLPEDGSLFATTERDDRINILMKKHDDGDFFHDVSNVPYFNLQQQQQQRQQQQKFLLSSGSSPVSRVSLQSPSECSSSSSSSLIFPNGLASPDNGSYYMNGFCFDSKSPDASYKMNARLVDEMGLSQSFCGLSIKEEHNSGSTEMKEFGFGGFNDLSLDGHLGYNVKKHGGSYGGSNNKGAFDIEGFQSSPHGVYDDGNHTFSGGFEKDAFVPMGSPLVAHNQTRTNDLYSGSCWYNNQSDYLLEQRGNWSDRGIQSQNSYFTGTCLNDSSVFPQHYKLDSNGGRGVIDSMGAFQSLHHKLDMNVSDPVYRSLMLKEMMRAIKNNEHSLMSMKGTEAMEAFSCEDSYIIQGKVLNHVSNKECEPLSRDNMNSLNEIPFQNFRGKSIRLDNCILNGESWENDPRISSYSPLPEVPSINSLSEVQGKIYLMAQDQNGCRWLQRIFDEGTSQDIQIIFNEIIDHVVELMLKPFGNYVIQKFLDVCNEEQRLQIVFMVTEEPGQLLRICLNTYGTRAVQKLIETLKTRQQISFVVMALRPGFLDLVKDQNGNHVIQRCLQCLHNDDNKFIFDAAAKFSVQIATHRHGCCVMQRCITHSTGKHREKLITEISKNALLLAQDPFGNYVVQYIVELKNPSAAVNLLSQFRRHYVHLSMQKFSSHVVEKCLKHLEESREQIVHELISVSRFEQLLQDPFANYVIQSALAVTKGPLRASLVAAVRPHVILRTNPYSKRIFSRNLLKK
ncbi:putative pumilio homolog 7, chloroplastic [Ricinus communis]|uniref:putative pumilio homolog 7, chloroplastic n=1 Tax=Ricinus communis TaxID=3988 RepID=UPI00201B058C|nr:putative pumilio homolog 7, chloroplastic [Ricinus communis]XP_015571610.2 putative pumilio homolog 7, chloroplastic [Ricinus communis]